MGGVRFIPLGAFVCICGALSAVVRIVVVGVVCVGLYLVWCIDRLTLFVLVCVGMGACVLIAPIVRIPAAGGGGVDISDIVGMASSCHSQPF